MSKRIDKYLDRKFRLQIIHHTASRLSEVSIEELRVTISQLPGENSLLKQMFNEDAIRRISFVETMPPKAFSIGFFQMQAVFEYIKHTRALVAIRSPNKDNPSDLSLKSRNLFLMQGSEKGFQRIEENKIKNGAPVVIFYGKARSDFEENQLQQKIQEIGLENMILQLIAQEPPYDRATSQFEDITNESAKSCIDNYRRGAASKDLDRSKAPFFKMYHIFCDSIQGEK